MKKVFIIFSLIGFLAVSCGDKDKDNDNNEKKEVVKTEKTFNPEEYDAIPFEELTKANEKFTAIVDQLKTAKEATTEENVKARLQDTVEAFQEFQIQVEDLQLKGDNSVHRPNLYTLCRKIYLTQRVRSEILSEAVSELMLEFVNRQVLCKEEWISRKEFNSY